MREIKFRGMSEESGKWLYGCLSEIGRYTTIMSKGVGEIVDVKTVGQYTGLKDSKEREIYEGDILSFWREKGYVVYRDEKAQYVVNFRQGKYEKSLALICALKDPVVIGNTYENPELLEREQSNA